MPVSRKGGSLMSSVTDLAVPFALILAKSGLEKLSENKPKPVKLKSAKTTPAKPKSTRGKRTQKGGSDCALCSGAQNMTAGEVHSARAHIRNEFQRLTNDLRALLKSY